MSKKTCGTIIVLTFALLLTPSAFADSVGAPAKSASSGAAIAWSPGVNSWLHSLMAWIEKALRETESQISAGSRGDSSLDQKPGRPEPSEPGMTLIPMDGADGDPNG